MKTKQLVALAEDSKFFAKYLIEGLEHSGFEVVFCRNAGEVIEQFSKSPDQRPTMLITDGLLAHGEEFSVAETRGGIDTGVAIYERLRKQFPDLSVIILISEESSLNKLRETHNNKLAVFANREIFPTQRILSKAKQFAGLP